MQNSYLTHAEYEARKQTPVIERMRTYRTKCRNIGISYHPSQSVHKSLRLYAMGVDSNKNPQGVLDGWLGLKAVEEEVKELDNISYH